MFPNQTIPDTTQVTPPAGGYNPFEDASVFAQASAPVTTAPSDVPDILPEVPPEAAPTDGAKPKRHRRTKAEMAAARAEEQRRLQELARQFVPATARPACEADAPKAVSAPESGNAGGIYLKLLMIRREVGSVAKDALSPAVRGVVDSGFRYRSLEGILSAITAAVEDYGCILLFDDQVVRVTDNYVYVKSEASLVDAVTGQSIRTSGWAREDFSLPNRWSSQITGACSTYARKYALSAMFAFSAGSASDPDADVAAVAGRGVRTLEQDTAEQTAAAVRKERLYPGVGAWALMIKQASDWKGGEQELEAAIRSRYDISDDDLTILLHKAGVLS